MSRWTCTAIILQIATLIQCTTSVSAQQITYAELVNRLTDLEHLARLPTAGERSAQWSSYNRASRYDAQTDRYIDWFAHADGTGYIRKEAEGYVLAEMEGPGCIWRIWTALPDTGRLIVILDGQRVYDMPFKQYFNHEHPHFAFPNLVYKSASGFNAYIPISYAKSCKIIATEGWGNYYNIGYTQFAPDANVEPFSPTTSPHQLALLHAADTKLGHPDGFYGSPDPLAVSQTEQFSLSPNATQTITLFGLRAITTLTFRLTSATPLSSNLLRNILLSITWDDQTQPAVWVPLGDFFGVTFAAIDQRALPLRTQNHTCESHWYMPFEKAAQIEIQNLNNVAIDCELEIIHAPLKLPIGQYGRFHAKWHRDSFPPKRADRKRDWTVLQTLGKGRYCGIVLNVWNPKGGWWGEGDEKFFIDQEKFPSIFGTGTEDYFGYAWADPTLFSRAYHGQMANDGLNRDHITLYRWHISDSIPFASQFEGSLEKYLPNTRPTRYDCVVFWYLSDTGEDPYAPIQTRLQTEDLNALLLPTDSDHIEGEEMRIANKTGGNCLIEETEFTNMQGGAQLGWVGANLGDTLTLEIPIPKTGTYNIQAQFTQAPDYGIIDIAIDQTIVIRNHDLYCPPPAQTVSVSLGKHHLSKGIHHLNITLTGINANAIKRYRVGLDFLRIQPATE